MKPTLLATFVLFGVSRPVAHLIQGGVMLVVAAIVVPGFRCGITDRSRALLQSGTCLAMPNAFRYDLSLEVNAILLVVGDATARRRPLHVIEAAILAVAWLAPGITTLTTKFFYLYVVSLILLFCLTAWRCLRQPAMRSPRTQSTQPVASIQPAHAD